MECSVRCLPKISQKFVCRLQLNRHIPESFLHQKFVTILRYLACTRPLPVHNAQYVAMWLRLFTLFRQIVLQWIQPGWEATLGNKLVVPGMMGILSVCLSALWCLLVVNCCFPQKKTVHVGGFSYYVIVHSACTSLSPAKMLQPWYISRVYNSVEAYYEIAV